MFSSHILNLVVLMILAGLIGGTTNYFINKKENESLYKSIAIGITASFLVPLFLNMISSDILEASKVDQLYYLIFLGFCLIAAISSKAFIQTMSDKMLKKVSSSLEEIESKLEPIIEKEAENDPSDSTDTRKAALDNNSKLIMNSLADGKYTFRSIGGISSGANLSKEVVLDTLNGLENQGLIGKINIKNKDYWFLKNKGRSISTG